MSASNEELNPAYEGWRVTAAAAAGVFLSFASVLVYTFGVFLKPVSAQFGWSRQAVSAAFGIAAMTVAACSPVLGRLLDRRGPRRIIVPCALVFGAAFASLALLTPRIWHLYAVFVVLGVVGNGTAQLAYARAVSTWFTAHRGMALAVMMAGGAVGSIVLPPAAQWLVDTVGWRGAFAVLGGMVVLAAPAIAAAFVRERPAGERRDDAHAFAGATVGEGLRSRVFWLLVAILFIASITQNAAITHLPALLSDRGVPADRAALAMSAMGVASLLGRIVTGYLLDRYFAPYVSVALLVLSAAGAYFLSTATTFPQGCAAAALIGVGMGGESDVTPYLLSRYLGLRSFSTLYGFTWTAYAIAGATGPVMMGLVFDALHSYTAFLGNLALLTLVAAALNFAMPAYPVRRTQELAAAAD
ncbi:MAG: MFS transporter [Candidatus Solibacter sp.]